MSTGINLRLANRILKIKRQGLRVLALKSHGYETASVEIDAVDRSPRNRMKVTSVTLSAHVTQGLISDGKRLVSLNSQWPGGSFTTGARQR